MALTTLILELFKKFVEYKRSSLFARSLGDEESEFYDSVTWLACFEEERNRSAPCFQSEKLKFWPKFNKNKL